MSVVDGNMESYFIGMWINFLFSSIVVATVLGEWLEEFIKRISDSGFLGRAIKARKSHVIGGRFCANNASACHAYCYTLQLLVYELSDELLEHTGGGRPSITIITL
jgi:two-component system sensor histidine kinase RegB